MLQWKHNYTLVAVLVAIAGFLGRGGAWVGWGW